MEAERWEEWTPCEMYGHAFDETGWCPDCQTQADPATPGE